MTRIDRDRWEERYRTADYTPREHPSPLLTDNRDWLPTGRALDIATGTGRNAILLADEGNVVDAIDVSRSALRRAREDADGGERKINWVQADLETGPLPSAEYDVIAVSFFRTYDRLGEIIDRLAPGGVLVYEHHLKTTDPVDRGPSDRWRFGSNDLLRLCSGLTILEYSEARRTFESGARAGQNAAIARLVARNSDGPAQSYPVR